MRKLRKAIPLALAMSVALTMTPIRASAEEPTQVQAEQSDLVEENESLSDEADKDNEGYELVFEDEFTGNQLDRTVWNVEKHEKGWVNKELQEYVDSDENIKVQDGCLNIIPVEKVETSTTDGQNLLSNADFSSGMDGMDGVHRPVPDLGHLHVLDHEAARGCLLNKEQDSPYEIQKHISLLIGHCKHLNVLQRR